ncbi:hypothetical protein WA158_003717 [Blastocystis sp. Blastoise]
MSLFDTYISNVPMGHYTNDSGYLQEGSNSFSYSMPSQQQQLRKQKFSLKSGKENQGRWTKEEHELFLKGLEKYGKDWKKIAGCIESRTIVQVRTHAQKYLQKLDSAKKEELLGNKINADRASYDSPTTFEGLQSRSEAIPSLSRSYSVDASRELYKSATSTFPYRYEASSDMPRSLSPSLSFHETSSPYLNTFMNTTTNNNNNNNISNNIDNNNIDNNMNNNTTIDNNMNNNNIDNNIPMDVINDNNSIHNNSNSFFSGVNSSFLDHTATNDTHDYLTQNRFSDGEYENRYIEEASASETLCSLLSECGRDFMTCEEYYYKRRRSSVYEEDMPDCFQINDS